MPKKLKVNKTLKKTRKIKNQKGGTVIEVINQPNTIKDILESFKIKKKNESFNPDNDIFAKLYLRTDRGDIPIAIWNNNCARQYIEQHNPLLKNLNELIDMQNIVLKYTKTNLDAEVYPFE